MSRHIDTPPAARIAFLETKLEQAEDRYLQTKDRLRQVENRYDELRELIDDGYQDADHEYALHTVRMLQRNLEDAEDQIVQMERDYVALERRFDNCRKELGLGDGFDGKFVPDEET